MLITTRVKTSPRSETGQRSTLPLADGAAMAARSSNRNHSGDHNRRETSPTVSREIPSTPTLCVLTPEADIDGGGVDCSASDGAGLMTPALRRRAAAVCLREYRTGVRAAQNDAPEQRGSAAHPARRNGISVATLLPRSTVRCRRPGPAGPLADPIVSV